MRKSIQVFILITLTLLPASTHHDEVLHERVPMQRCNMNPETPGQPSHVDS